MKIRNVITALVATAALSLISSGLAQANSSFGHIDAFQHLKNYQVMGQNGQNLGTINDVVVDLESGRALYALFNSGGQEHAVPASLFQQQGQGNSYTLNTDQQKVNGAPNPPGGNDLGSLNYITQLYNYYGVQPWWGATATGQGGNFGNVHKASTLIGANVKSSNNQDLGKIDSVFIDLPTGRVPYLSMTGNGFGNQGQAFPIPPMAFTKGPNDQTLITGLNQQQLQSAPQVSTQAWEQQLQNPQFAANVYQFYGKQPYWQAGNTTQFGQNSTPNPQFGDNSTNNYQVGQSSGSNPQWQTPTGNQTGGNLGHMEGIQHLKNLQITSQTGQNLGKIDDVVVDLDSGRALYALVNSGGQEHAVPPQLFQQQGQGNSFKLNTDQQKLNGAPSVPGGNGFGSMNYITQLYNYYGVQPWWGSTATGQGGNLGNVHKAGTLVGANVQSSDNQNLGKISSVLIDLPTGRVPFLSMTGNGFGKQGQVFPIPPMALSQGPNPQTLVTGLTKDKLQSAPELPAHQWRGQLDNPQFAANVYQYYGKQPYWQVPTSTQPGSRVYPQNP